MSNSSGESTLPSPRLWRAALAGLLGGCAEPAAHNHSGEEDPVSESAAATDPVPEPELVCEVPKEVTSTERVEDLTFASFRQDCFDRGGVVQSHATCAGNNACAGFSFNKWSKELTEHTCRGMNSCGGASCVVLPEDQGRDAADLYEQNCGSMCHGTNFTLYVPPGADPVAAEANFRARSFETHVAAIAFGLRGLTAAGNAYANMPAFHEKLSRAEIERLVAHLQSLDVEPSTFQVSGETEDFTEAE
jgi:hypothetical protein